MLTPWALALAHLAVRVTITATRSITNVSDTSSYQTVRFVGDATSPWVLPVLFAVTTDPMMVITQTVVSALAFLTLAAIASTLDDRRVRIGTGVFLALLGLTPRITTWDTMLITESLSISFTLLLVAAIARRDLLGHRWVSVGTGVVLVLWPSSNTRPAPRNGCEPRSSMRPGSLSAGVPQLRTRPP